jgi:hypothetical protein
MIIIGRRFYGSGRRIIGVAEVRTRFFHINYVPLIPLGSWLLQPGTASGWRLSRLQWGAAAMAWLRTALIVQLIVFPFVAAVNWFGDPSQRPYAIGAMAATAAAACALFWTFRRDEVPFDDAARLVAMAGSPAELVSALQDRYGRTLEDVDFSLQSGPSRT